MICQITHLDGKHGLIIAFFLRATSLALADLGLVFESLRSRASVRIALAMGIDFDSGRNFSRKRLIAVTRVGAGVVGLRGAGGDR